ncbi:uncharacterized protein LOC126766962 [Bactrocera neohumeralis]|uniref:uncharacterized protein LOC126766962 n=1 Tax=Bactrocera neohumeralis TaxID=98809 RepID=UPI002166107F|nr:uncharacterized protein LOC126766962 [Bactrocera neohumeralis]
MYVFPGGGVDDEDVHVAVDVGFLPKDTPADRSAEQKHLQEVWSSRIAALRELSEETSCVLRAHSTIESREDWQNSEGGKRSGRPFDVLAAPLLTPLGRWITPEESKYRYDTYFYGAVLKGATEAGRDHSLPPQLVKLQSEEREISSLLWVSPLEALIRHELPEEAFTLPPPTFHLLSALARVPSFAWLADQWHQRRRDLSPTDTPEELSYPSVTPGTRTREGEGGHLLSPS